MDIFLTILTGVAVFVMGQIVIKLFVDPVHAMKVVIADIAHCLILRANVYANPRPPDDEVNRPILEEFRVLSSRLHSAMRLVPFYSLTSKIFWLPSLKDVNTASQNLISLYNGSDNNLKNQSILNTYASQRVRQALDIYIPENERLNEEDERHFISAKEN